LIVGQDRKFRRATARVERLNALVGSETTAPFSPLSAGGWDLSERVDRIAQSLLAKAVEIDHERQKNRQNLP